MRRLPVVAGQFYPADSATLANDVGGFLALADEREKELTLLAMVPHAGYVFSGGICGKTLGEANLSGRVLLLGPNHTGRGAKIAVWADGSWKIPGGEVSVDGELAAAVIASHPSVVADTAAHESEHSLEVVLPFLHALDQTCRVTPVCISEYRLDVLADVGRCIAEAIRNLDEPVTIVVSSDMSHFVSQEEAREQDTSALEQALKLSPEALYATVRDRGISMCGVLPMTLGLFIVRELGASHARLVAYGTSGNVTGDMDNVVGYAGVIVC